MEMEEDELEFELIGQCKRRSLLETSLAFLFLSLRSSLSLTQPLPYLEGQEIRGSCAGFGEEGLPAETRRG